MDLRSRSRTHETAHRFISLTVWVGSALPAYSATRRIVLLFDERPELPGLALLQADLTLELTSNSADRIEIYSEALDLTRFGSNNYQPLLRDFLQEKYADKKIDVAIAVLSPSLDLLLNYGSVIFPETPIIFCGIDKTELGNRDSMDSAEPRVLSVLSVTSEIAGANGVRVSIADTGRGIDVANLNRIFQPMFTTKTRGMGMGLSICKSVIENHNGHIWASANVPRGSIFQFELAANGAKH